MKICSVEGCDKKHFAKSYCDFHYRRIRRYGVPEYLGVKRPQGVSLVRNEIGQKQCAQCDLWLPESEYYGGANTLDTLSVKCKSCAADMRRAQVYNVPRDWYAKRLAEQDFKCDLCHREVLLSTGQIDHDHACCDRAGSCGKCVRGILCQACNLLLGLANDDVDRLLAAITYLEAYS